MAPGLIVAAATLAFLVAGHHFAGSFASAFGAAHRASPGPGAAAKLPTVGFLVFEIRDADTGELMPGKVTLLGANGTPDPRMTTTDIGREEAGAVAAYNRIFSLSGAGMVVVPAGQYDATVSRGLEWDLAAGRRVTIIEGAATTLSVKLRHVLETPGWISADFHVHAAPSPDSIVPLRHRVYEFVSDGVEVITATDHNVVSDYGPEIADLGVGDLITGLVGDELTTNGWGHFGAFPLVQRREESGSGAVHLRGRTPEEMFAEVRERAPDAVIDVHHPRIDDEIGYFNMGRLSSETDEAERPGFSFDFDAVEVLNGYQDPDRKSVDRVIADWYLLLDHGHLVTATGNSDTHHLTYNLGGYPRNYVLVRDDRPAHVTPQEIAQSVKGRHVFITTGPVVSLRVAGAQIGDVVQVRGGRATAEVKVQAAPWVSVSRAILYVNGVEHHRWEVPDSTELTRLDQRLELSVSRDSYVTLRVDGTRPLAPVVGDMKRFDVRPFALTNPVFLDVDGKPGFDAPHPHGTHPPLRRWLRGAVDKHGPLGYGGKTGKEDEAQDGHRRAGAREAGVSPAQPPLLSPGTNAASH
jgi:hypothetical protein